MAAASLLLPARPSRAEIGKRRLACLFCALTLGEPKEVVNLTPATAEALVTTAQAEPKERGRVALETHRAAEATYLVIAEQIRQTPLEPLEPACTKRPAERTPRRQSCLIVAHSLLGLAPTRSDPDIDVGEVLGIERQRREPVEYLDAAPNESARQPPATEDRVRRRFHPEPWRPRPRRQRCERAPLISRRAAKSVEQRQSCRPISCGDGSPSDGSRRCARSANNRGGTVSCPASRRR